jgi:hypothetical protein
VAPVRGQLGQAHRRGGDCPSLCQSCQAMRPSVLRFALKRRRNSWRVPRQRDGLHGSAGVLHTVTGTGGMGSLGGTSGMGGTGGGTCLEAGSLCEVSAQCCSRAALIASASDRAGRVAIAATRRRQPRLALS